MRYFLSFLIMSSFLIFRAVLLVHQCIFFSLSLLVFLLIYVWLFVCRSIIFYISRVLLYVSLSIYVPVWLSTYLFYSMFPMLESLILWDFHPLLIKSIINIFSVGNWRKCHLPKRGSNFLKYPYERPSHVGDCGASLFFLGITINACIAHWRYRTVLCFASWPSSNTDLQPLLARLTYAFDAIFSRLIISSQNPLK